MLLYHLTRHIAGVSGAAGGSCSRRVNGMRVRPRLRGFLVKQALVLRIPNEEQEETVDGCLPFRLSGSGGGVERWDQPAGAGRSHGCGSTFGGGGGECRLLYVD